MEKKIVYVLSSGHSGSTILGYLLGGCDGAYLLGEFVHTNKSTLNTEKRGRIKRNGLCSVHGTECFVWGGKYPRTFADAFDKFGRGVLIDTSKNVQWVKRTAIGYNHAIVRITRNGLDRFGSIKKKQGKLTEKQIVSWVRQESIITRFLDNKPHYSVKFEDLGSDSTMIGLCNKVGLQCTPDIYGYRDYHCVRGNAAVATKLLEYGGFKYVDKRDYMSKADIKMFKNVGGFSVNKDLGYRGK